MNFRKIVSLSIALTFLVLTITGILSYLQAYSRPIASLHTIFGGLFVLGVLFHLSNNLKALIRYSTAKYLLPIAGIVAMVFLGAIYGVKPVASLMDYGSRLKAKSVSKVDQNNYLVLEMDHEKEIKLDIDLLRAEHYWHPQMAIWTEDIEGNYLETIFVSRATAKGLFFGGRTKENFKTFDEKQKSRGEYRRVNALPVWAHKRGVRNADGMYVPSNRNPLPDAITGATLDDSFKLYTSVAYSKVFVLRLELNVAFDDNEYYSEYDFPDDTTFHNGTGQLGQPSIIFETKIEIKKEKEHYLMKLIGHGHHSGQTGELYTDLSTLTTAKELVERIVVGVEHETVGHQIVENK